MLYGNIELDENGFSSAFKIDPLESDIKIKLIKCRQATNFPSENKPEKSIILNGKELVVYYDAFKEKNVTFISGDRFYFTERVYTEGRFLWSYIDLPGILVENNRVMFHCSYIIDNGEAILFCGKSGIGKSTQADLWAKYNGAEIINGDKAVIYMNDGVPYVSSVPVAGTSGICKNKSAPLKAIISLGKAKENRLSKLSSISALTKVFENCIFDSWRDGEADKCIGIISEIIKNVNVYDFACLPDETAVEVLKKEF